MKNYRLKNSYKPKTGRLIYKILFFILVLLFLIFNFTSPAFISNTISTIAKPLWYAADNIKIKISNFSNGFRSKQKLAKENDLLKNAVRNSSSALLNVSNLKSENESLKQLLGRETNISALLAYVLKKPGSSPYDTLLLDLGSSDGLKVGDLISDSGSVTLGRIEEVRSKTSSARLFSSAGIITSAKLERSNLPISLQGIGGGAFEAKLQRDIEIRVGDIVRLSDGNFQVVAIVRDIESDIADSFQTIQLASPINFNELKWVLVYQ